MKCLSKCTYSKNPPLPRKIPGWAPVIYSSPSLSFYFLLRIIEKNINPFFYKQRFFSTQPQCCLTISWTELQMLLSYCLIHISIIIVRHFLYLLYLCSWLALGLFISYLCDVFFIFIFIFIMIYCIISWIQTHFFFCLFFKICPIIFG